MLFEGLSGALIHYWHVVLFLAILTRLLKNYFHNGLRKYPGPAFAGVTNLWRFFMVLGRKGHERQYELSKKYGGVVRIGPNFLLFSEPKAINDIYGLKKGFVKTQFYQVQNAITNGRRIQSLFSTIDEDYHARFRRCVNSSFAMSTLVSYEPLVDKTIVTFLEQTKRHFIAPGKTCDFARWVQFYAFDVIGEITWSKRLGFLERNEDVDGIIDFIGKFMQYAAPVGQMPWIDYLLMDKNPVKMLLAKFDIWTSGSPVAKFAMDRARERQGEDFVSKALATPPSSSDETADPKAEDAFADVEKGTDFLTRFKASQKSHPDFMSDFQVLTATVSLIFAGSDTTATTLSVVFYYLLRNPPVFRKLLDEIHSLEETGLISPESQTVPWAVASKHMPYLDAVVQESFRMLSAIALPLERHVPARGAVIAGNFVPGGTIVGVNAYIVHRDKDVFGADAESYRPERWIEAAEANDGGKKLREMKATMFQFGAGARTCIGRHIATLEMYKLVPSFLRRYEVEFVDPEREWDPVNAWFIKIEGFFVRFRERVRD